MAAHSCICPANGCCTLPDAPVPEHNSCGRAKCLGSLHTHVRWRGVNGRHRCSFDWDADDPRSQPSLPVGGGRLMCA
jgi:hypothetical protein